MVVHRRVPRSVFPGLPSPTHLPPNRNLPLSKQFAGANVYTWVERDKQLRSSRFASEYNITEKISTGHLTANKRFIVSSLDSCVHLAFPGSNSA